MLDLLKKNIHMNRQKGNVATQLTLDDDFIVPDTMDDVEQIILATGEVQVESSKNQGDRVIVRGNLAFQILYRREGGGLQTLAGRIPFEESINVPELDEKDYVQIFWNLEDLTAGIINSRKLNIRAVITLEVKVDALCDAAAAVDVDAGGLPVEILRRNEDVAAISARRKDTFRVKENIQIPGNKPNIDRILWQEMKLQGVNTKPLDGEVHVDGELMVFVIYSGEGENMPVQWLEESIPFSGELSLPDAIEEMIPSIRVRLIHKEVEAKPDADGEMRELEVDGILELDMRLYEEERVNMLSDMYSTKAELILETGEACFEKLLAKNVCKTRLSEKVRPSRADRILQICHCDGTVKMDEITPREDGLHVDGVLEVTLLYLTSDDSEPVGSSVEALPFSCVIEAAGMNEDTSYQVTPGIEQLSAVMLGGGEVEIKAVVTLDMLALQPVCIPVIQGVRSEPADLERLESMPGIVGYIVQPGDSLWKIAKKFHTTVEAVMEANGLSSDALMPGDRLILVKTVQ